MGSNNNDIPNGLSIVDKYVQLLDENNEGNKNNIKIKQLWFAS